MQVDQISEGDLKATWHAVLNDNEPRFVQRRLTPQEIFDIKMKRYPKKCFFSDLKAGKNVNKTRSGSDRARKKIVGAHHSNKEKILVYQLACVESRGKPNGRLTASHLCGNFQCINPAHVCWETLQYNHTRDCCLMFASVKGYKCPHNPPCLEFEDRQA